MSTKLLESLHKIKQKPIITLGDIVRETQDDALIMITVICILPFMQPVPLPGLSSLLGLIVLLQGIALFFFNKPILTKKMEALTISDEKFAIIYKASVKMVNIFKVISFLKHPMIGTRISHMVCSIFVIFSATILSLPLPIPFSNFIPALSIFLMAIGLLERDVLLTLIGIMISLAVLWMSIVSYHIMLQELQRLWF